MGDMTKAIERAVAVLRNQKEVAIVGRRKFEPGGNLYILILQQSPAAEARVALIDQEITELDQAIAFLEKELN